MEEYISSFTTGFERIVAHKASQLLRGMHVLGIFDGMIHYTFNGDSNAILRVPFFNNTFFVLRCYRGKTLSFSRMVADVSARELRYPITKGTFRVRFSNRNQFVGVDKKTSLAAEAAAKKFSHLRIDRLNPTTELWYVIRQDGFGFYGQLLKKRVVTEKNLHRGELRPEFAYLMCCCGAPNKNSVVLDPFAGFGSIPAQILKHFSVSRLIACDIDKEKVSRLSKRLSLDGSRVQVFTADALNLQGISDKSIDIIVTDPPWGYYEEIGDIKLFYMNMLSEFRRIMKENGKIVLLSARKDELIESIKISESFHIEDAIHTLVNGKKASVFVLNPKS